MNVDSLMEDIAAKGRYDGYTFAQKSDPCMSLFVEKAMCLFTAVPRATPGNTNVPVTIATSEVGFPADCVIANPTKGHTMSKASHLVARTDEGHIKALDPETLEPIGIAHQQSLHHLLKGPLSASHSQTDPSTGDVFNYNLDLGYETTYRVFKTSARTGKTGILATISSPGIAPAYMHSSLLTEDFVVLCVWNAHLMAGGIKVL